ncbi:AMP-binding protein [Streptomyces sp. NPDC050418]|uniref:AMP-binding protein n=1 Tax=Streptomyces sp. NPDC050418 TaxID=3365612 RepID=UPI0037A90D5B
MLDGCTPWPEEFVDRYWMGGHWRGDTLDRLLREQVAAGATRTALIHGDTRLTYGQLNRRVDRMAAGFRLRGLTARQRVVVQLPDVPDSVLALFALMRLGVVPVMCPMAYRAEEMARVVQLAQAVGYVGPSSYEGFDHTAMAADLARGPFLRRVFTWEPPGTSSPFGGATVDGAGCHYFPLASLDSPPEPMPAVRAGEVALLLAADRVRLVPRTHDDLACQVRVVGEAVSLGEGDVYLGGDVVGVLGALFAGAAVVLAEDVVPAAVCEEVTVADSPRTSANGESNGVRFVRDHVHSTVEGIVLCVTDGGAWVVPPGDDALVAGAEGGTGELLVRGPHVVRGYYRESGTDRFSADGFLRTGIRVRQEADGRLVRG